MTYSPPYEDLIGLLLLLFAIVFFIVGIGFRQYFIDKEFENDAMSQSIDDFVAKHKKDYAVEELQLYWRAAQTRKQQEDTEEI